MTDRYDYIVVGAGTAGAVLASRLSSDPARRVLLLESGPDFAAKGQVPEVLATGEPVTEDGFEWDLVATFCGRDQHYPRGRVVGGCSSINSRGAVRAPAADFDEWAALGLPGWSFADVLPSYCRVETDAQFADLDYHGARGPIPITRWDRAEFVAGAAGFTDALLALGHPFCADINAPHAVGVGPYPQNRRGRERISTAQGYLRLARARPNLTVHGDSTVERVVLRDGRAIGVRVGGETILGAEVVLCAGSPHSPLLLLRSGIGPADELRAAGVPPVLDLPGVGSNLIDQPGAVLFAAATPEADPPHWPRLQAYARLPGFPAHGDDGGFYLCLFGMRLDRGPQAALSQVLGVPSANGLMVGDMRMASRGRVALRAATETPVLDLGFYTAPGDLARMVAGFRYAWEVANQASFSAGVRRFAFVDDATIADDELLARMLAGSTFSRANLVGGATMGPLGDAMAVVDERCRVRGLAGLRVVDASIVPVALRAPAALTCMMLGEHAAAMIISDG